MTHKKRKPVRVKGKLVIPKGIDKPSERERRRSISGIRDVKRGISGKDRLELARARGGAGQQFALEDGKITSTTEEERRKKDVEEVAKRNFEIGLEKDRLLQQKLLEKRAERGLE